LRVGWGPAGPLRESPTRSSSLPDPLLQRLVVHAEITSDMRDRTTARLHVQADRMLT
jgi:hypothetical protein